MRGEQWYGVGRTVSHEGPSPRARGSGDRSGADRAHRRSIPACAGFRRPIWCGSCAPAVHPRVRGVQPTRRLERVLNTGPSPRARGSGRHHRPVHAAGRSIPACAGLRPVRRKAVRACSVHPRVRGVQPATLSPWRLLTGPSPRARGSGENDLRKQRPLSSRNLHREATPFLTHPYHTHPEATRERAPHRSHPLPSEHRPPNPLIFPYTRGPASVPLSW